MRFIYPGIAFKGMGEAFPYPDSKVSNEDIHPLVYGPQWQETFELTGKSTVAIKEKHGFETRYWANQPILGKQHHPVSSESLMIEAGLNCLQDAELDPKKIDLLLVACTTTQHVSPAASRFISNALGLNCPGFDMKNGCSTTVYALETASLYLQNPAYKNVLLVAGETFSNWIGEGNHKVYAAGDGAAAVILTKDASADCGVLYSKLGAESQFLEETGISGELPPRMESVLNGKYLLQMTPDIYPFVIRKWEEWQMTLSVYPVLDFDAIDYIVSNQVNSGTRQLLASLFHRPIERVIDRVSEVGNCGCPGPLLALHKASRLGLLSAGKTVLICTVGTGLSWGALLLKI